MFASLLPKTVPFFDMLQEQNQFFCNIAEQVQNIFFEYDKRFLASKRIAEIEFDADMLYRKLIRGLSQSFITPIDREDILRIAQMQEECIDKMQNISTRLIIGDLSRIRFPGKKIAELLKGMADLTTAMLRGLSTKRDVHQMRAFRSKREEADSVLLVGLGELMDLPHDSTSQDLLLVMQWIQIYDRLEQVIGKVTDLAETIDEAVLKNV